jgi:hypothetical protein
MGISWGESIAVGASVSNASIDEVRDEIDSIYDDLVAGNYGGGLSWSLIAINTLAVSGNGYLVNASGGDITVTLPATPSEGDIVGVCDAYRMADTNTITVARNGENINSVADDLTIDMEGAGFSLVFVDATRGWEIVDEVTGSSAITGIQWHTVSGDTTAVNGNGYMINASSNTVTITLPLAPSEGDTVGISDSYRMADTYAITVARNSENINSIAEDLVVNIEGASFTLAYVNSTVGWQVVSDIGFGELRGVIWESKAADFNAVAGTGYALNATSNTITATMPVTPGIGDQIAFCDIYNKATTNTITIERNGNNIEGAASDLVLSVDGVGITLVYTDATRGWEIVSGTLSTGYTASRAMETDGSGNLVVSAITATELSYLNDVPDSLTKLAPQYNSIYIDAGAMVPCTTNGAEASTEEYGTNDIDMDVLAFDAGATEERAQFKLVMPENWDRSTIKAKFYWGNATGASAADTIEWGIKAGALSDDDAIDAALGTPQVITDTVIADGDLHITSATPSLTIGGTPALGDLVEFEVYRNTDGTDDMVEDAWLLGVLIQYKVDQTVSAW